MTGMNGTQIVALVLVVVLVLGGAVTALAALGVA